MIGKVIDHQFSHALVFNLRECVAFFFWGEKVIYSRKRMFE